MKTNNKLNPHTASTPGFEPAGRTVRGEREIRLLKEPWDKIQVAFLGSISYGYLYWSMNNPTNE